MDQENEVQRLEWGFDRRWGVEMEINAFDSRSRPPEGEQPKGIVEVGRLVNEVLDEPVQITKWVRGGTHNNEAWVIKPDGSCGMEVCSPVMKGWNGLERVLKLVEAFRADPRITADHRCSFHVHVNVADLLHQEVGNVAANWVKSEPVFIDSVPVNRKRSRYCQIIGMCDMFDHREILNPEIILDRLGRVKYFTMNNVHYSEDRRKTVEYRIAENEFCLDAFHAKNWIKLVVLFTEYACRKAYQPMYKYEDPWGALSWLDPKDVLSLMRFMPEPDVQLSEGLKQTRDWFIARMDQNMLGSGLPGLFSDAGRSYARQELNEVIAIINSQGGSIGEHSLVPPNLQEALYDPRFRL